MAFFNTDKFNLGRRDRLFGDALRGLGLKRDFGISELFGGEKGSLERQQNRDRVSREFDKRRSDNVFGVGDFNGPFLGGGSSGGSSGGGGSRGGSSGGGGSDIVGEKNIFGALIRQTKDGNILGLSDLKKTKEFREFVNKGLGKTGGDFLKFLQEGGGGQPDISGEVDKAFGESSRLLNEQEKLLRGARPDLLKRAESPFLQAINDARAAIEQGRGRFSEGVSQAQESGRGLLSDARRLADELRRRNQQMFGGSALSSAGLAAGELLGRETSRQFGNIRGDTAKSVQQLQQGLIDFNNQSEAQLQNLELQKNEALSRAELEFRDRLSEINNARNVLAQNKAAMKLDALRQFRAQVANVQAQEQAFRQNVQLLREQARINLQNELSAIQSGVGQAGGNINDFLSQLGESGIGSRNDLGISQDVTTPPSIQGRVLFPGKDKERGVPNIFKNLASTALNTAAPGAGLLSNR